MTIEITIDEKEIKKVLKEYIASKLGDIPFDEKKFSIKVKSTQNYKSEWEEAAFKAEYRQFDV